MMGLQSASGDSTYLRAIRPTHGSRSDRRPQHVDIGAAASLCHPIDPDGTELSRDSCTEAVLASGCLYERIRWLTRQKGLVGRGSSQKVQDRRKPLATEIRVPIELPSRTSSQYA